MVADLIWLGHYSDQRPLRIIQLLQEVKEAALGIEWVLNPSCTAQRAPGCRKHWLLREALNQWPGCGQLLRYSWHSAKTSVLAALPQQMSAFHVCNPACRKTWGVPGREVNPPPLWRVWGSSVETWKRISCFAMEVAAFQGWMELRACLGTSQNMLFCSLTIRKTILCFFSVKFCI